MAGGGGKQGGSDRATVTMPYHAPPPQAQIPYETGAHTGPTMVPQTYTPEAAPAWMQGGAMDLGGQGYMGMDNFADYVGMIPGKAPGYQPANYYQMPQWGMDAVTGQPVPQAPAAPAAPAAESILDIRRRLYGYGQGAGATLPNAPAYPADYFAPNESVAPFSGYGGRSRWTSDRNDGG